MLRDTVPWLSPSSCLFLPTPGVNLWRNLYKALVHCWLCTTNPTGQFNLTGCTQHVGCWHKLFFSSCFHYHHHHHDLCRKLKKVVTAYLNYVHSNRGTKIKPVRQSLVLTYRIKPVPEMKCVYRRTNISALYTSRISCKVYLANSYRTTANPSAGYKNTLASHCSFSYLIIFYRLFSRTLFSFKNLCNIIVRRSQYSRVTLQIIRPEFNCW